LSRLSKLPPSKLPPGSLRSVPCDRDSASQDNPLAVSTHSARFVCPMSEVYRRGFTPPTRALVTRNAIDLADMEHVESHVNPTPNDSQC
jgi:hypothetical protein